MAKPEDIKVEASDSKEFPNRYKVSWKCDNQNQNYSIRVINTLTQEISKFTTVGDSCYIPMKPCKQKVIITAKSTDLNKFADSEPVTVMAPDATDNLQKYYNRGSTTMDLTKSSCKVTDLEVVLTIGKLVEAQTINMNVISHYSAEFYYL